MKLFNLFRSRTGGFTAQRSPLATALEPRMMFDGAVAATVAEAATTPTADAPAAQDADSSQDTLAAVPSATADQRQEVVFIVGNVANAQQLVDAIEPGTEVVVLDGNQDGLRQIADYLEGREGIDAIHIISHGAEGQLHLGTVTLDQANLASRAGELAVIGRSLSDDGDILLYGCDVARDGDAFIQQLAALTGADIAASTDPTGAARLGGDWQLEASTGSIEAGSFWYGAADPSYDHLLATVTLNEDWLNNNADDWAYSDNQAGGDLVGVGDAIYFNVDTAAFDTPPVEFTIYSISDTPFNLDSITVRPFESSNDYRLEIYPTGNYAAKMTSELISDQSGQSIVIDPQLMGITSFTVRFVDFGVDYPYQAAPSSLDFLSFATSPAIVTVAPTLSATPSNPTFTENGSAVDLFDDVTAATNDDGQTFSGATLTVTNVSNGAAEILTIGGADIALADGNEGSIAGIGDYSVSVAGGTATVTLSGMTRSDAQMGTLIGGITYRNTSDDPGDADRVVTITEIADSGGGNNTATPNIAATVSVTPVNDAPVLTAIGGTPTYTENGAAVDLFSDVIISTVEDGQSITGLSLTVANLADGASEILTIDGTDIALTNGTSGTTTGGSAVGYSVTVVGGTATVTLTSAGLSTANAQTLVDGISYRNSSEAPDTGSRVVTLTSITDSGGTANGGGDTSTLAIAATVAINAVNDAPALSGGPYSLTGTDEDSSSSGTLVSTILAGLTHADVDGPDSGIAITASSGNGTWEYSTDGVTWNDVGSVSGSDALLLSSSTQLRYVPDGMNGETATLSFRAWDQTSGAASTSMTRSTTDTTSNGGSSAFSSGTASASLVVAAVNDAPELTPAAPILDGLNDSDTDNPGQTVASIVGASISDVDTGAVGGIAITGLDSGNGTWQYSLDGSDWSDIGSVSTGGALLLRATDHVRFVPDGVNATTASFTYRAWDQSGASAGQQGSKVDTTVSGGSSAFSSSSDTASVTVTAINDAPILTTSGGTTGFTEADGGPSTPVAIDAGLTLSDPDNATLASATVTITGSFQPGEDVLIFANDGSSMGNITASYNAGSGVLTLTSAGATATLAQWQAALRTVAYTNGSDTPNEATRTIGFVVNDGQDSSTAATKAIGVTSVNDTPQVSVPATIDVTEDVASAITGISFSDADAGSGSVTVTLAVDSGSLSATSGGGVIVGGVSSSLTLTGSIADINAFIASSNVSFVTALNATANVTLIASINDGGNTGSGGAKSDSDTTTLQVATVNDAPVISAPATIAVDEDVTTALTGISFSDVDAGTSPVTVTFSVPSGTLVATSGDGVTVGGTSGSMTLTGSIADINAYIAAGNVTFTTAANSTSDVTLSMAIDDGGNTGSGGAQTDATTVTLAVTAVNDAPVNSVPAAQAIDQDAVLVFNDANGNLISISDVDAGSNTVEVTLTASNGLMTLGSIAGLSFSTGDGSADATMTFSGSIADINNALNGLVFSPTGGYNGPASIQIETNDQGWSGSGGAQSDVDTIAITVSPLNPEVVSVQAVSPDGGYKAGDTVTVTVTFDQVVSVDTSGGVPTLLLETGSIDRNAIYVSGSGSNTLTFSYVVQAGDVAADLDYQSTAALALNGATIRSAGNDDAILVLPALGGADSLAGNSDILIDGAAPSVGSVSVPANGTYVAGQNLDFTVNFDEAVTVDTGGGVPRLAVTLDTGGTVYADYLSGSGSGALVFRLTIASGQLDSNGVSLGSSIQLNGSTLKDAVGNEANTILNGVASTAGVHVDAVRPTATISVADTALAVGQTSLVTITFSEAVSGFTSADLSVANGTLDGLSSSDGGITWTAILTPAADIEDSSNLITLNNTGVQDLAGNTGSGTTDSNNYAIDTLRPTATIVVANPILAAGDSSLVTITFNEAVTGLTTADLSIANGVLSGLSSSDGGITWTATLTPNANVADTSNLITLANTGVQDAAGNTGLGTTDSNNYAIDSQAPVVSSVSVPANGTYVAGQNLDFTVNFDEAVTVDASGGTPRLAVTLDTGGTVYADYLSGSGSGALVFRLTIASGQLDSNGVSLGSSIQLNGSTLKDAVGNDAVTTLNGVDATTDVRIDAVIPTVASVSVPLGMSYNSGDVLSFVINASEAVIVNTAGGTPQLALDIGGNTVYAGYVAGSGTTTLVFQYTVQPGDTDSDGIAVTGLTTNGGALHDVAGNAMNLALVNVGDTSNVLVDTTAPEASGIVRVDASPTNASSVSYTVTFSEGVTNVDISDFTLVTTGTANGSITTITQIDAQTYTLVVSGITGSGNIGLDLNVSGTGIVDSAGNALATGLAGEFYTVDRVAPSVGSVSVPANGTYVAGQNLDFTVNFDEAVTVDASGGTPRLAVTLDTGGTVYADYLSGSGSGALVFRLTIASGQLDSNGVSLGSSIQLNGSTLKDAVGNDANTVLDGVASTAGVHVDAQAPSIASVGVPVGVPYNAGDVLSFTVNTSENVVVDTTGGTPRLAIDIGGVTRYASYVAGSGTSTLVFQYSVQTGDNDADGVTLAGTLDLNGSAIRDAAGNALLPTLNNPGDASGVIVDTDAPAASAIVTLDANPTSAGSVRYTVTFDEAVTGVDTSDFSLVLTGSASGSITTVTQLDGRTYSVLVTGLSGEGTLRLDLNASGTGIVDSAGNAIAGGLSGQSYQLVAAPLDHGDPEFRVNPPTSLVEAPNTPLQPTPPSVPLPPTSSPLLPPPLFEVPTLGSGIPTLGNIFINQNALAPSYIAQVFSSSSDVGGDGAGVAIPGFGGGVFGSSSLSSVFGSDTPQDAAPLEVFDGKKWGSGGAAGFGAPTLGQQLRDIREGEQRPLRELAHALQQISAAQAQT